MESDELGTAVRKSGPNVRHISHVRRVADSSQPPAELLEDSRSTVPESSL